MRVKSVQHKKTQTIGGQIRLEKAKALTLIKLFKFSSRKTVFIVIGCCVHSMKRCAAFLYSPLSPYQVLAYIESVSLLLLERVCGRSGAEKKHAKIQMFATV